MFLYFSKNQRIHTRLYLNVSSWGLLIRVMHCIYYKSYKYLYSYDCSVSTIYEYKFSIVACKNKVTFSLGKWRQYKQ